jgi:ribonuclease P protein component
VKRWVREFVRRHKGDLPAGECVLVAKTSSAGIEHAAVDRDLERLFARSRRSS